jgi:hypothetical protein
MADMQQALSIEVLLQLYPGTLVPCCISTPVAFHTRRLCSQHPSRKEFEFTWVKTAASKNMVKVLFCAPAPPHSVPEWFLVMMHNCMLNESLCCGFINALWSRYNRQGREWQIEWSVAMKSKRKESKAPRTTLRDTKSSRNQHTNTTNTTTCGYTV